jgi:hypothetical protein
MATCLSGQTFVEGIFDRVSCPPTKENSIGETSPISTGSRAPAGPIYYMPLKIRTESTLSHHFRGGVGLLPSTGPFWRTAFCTEKAIEHLCGRVAGVFAIVFEQEASEEEQPGSREEAPKEKKRESGKRKSAG